MSSDDEAMEVRREGRKKEKGRRMNEINVKCFHRRSLERPMDGIARFRSTYVHFPSHALGYHQWIDGLMDAAEFMHFIF